MLNDPFQGAQAAFHSGVPVAEALHLLMGYRFGSPVFHLDNALLL